MAYYTPSGNPVAQSRGASATQRSEFSSIQAGFNKLPDTTQVWGNNAHYGVDTGVADAYLVTVASTYLTSYTDGMCVKVKALNANTGAATINVNSLGVKSLTRPDGTALQVGDIVSGQSFEITYNATTGKFQLMNAYGGPAGPTGTLAGNASAGINYLAGPSIASAATLSGIWTGSQGNEMVVTGTTTTSSFGTAPQAGASRVLIPSGGWSVAAGANLLVPGVASGTYTFAAGDVVTVHAITTTQFRLEITRNDGQSILGNAVLLKTQSGSAASACAITGFVDSSRYSMYDIEIVSWDVSTGSIPWVRTSTDGGATYDSGAANYGYAGTVSAPSPSVAAFGSTGDTKIALSDTAVSGTLAHGGFSGRITLRNPDNATRNKLIKFAGSLGVGASTVYDINVTGVRLSTADIDAIQLLPSTGTITYVVRVWGYP